MTRHFLSGDTLLSHPDKYFIVYRNQTGSLFQIPILYEKEDFKIIKKTRGYPSLVKGAGFRVPSRRRSQVQLLLHAFVFFIDTLQILIVGFKKPTLFFAQSETGAHMGYKWSRTT